MERRIAPPGSSDLLALLESLVNVERPIFRSKQKALMFAASLGWSLRARAPIERRGEPIRYSIFEGALDDGFVNALAVAETRDLKVLGSDREDERVKIFEEYAHGGLQRLQVLVTRAGDPLDLIMEPLMEARLPPSVHEGVAPDLARLLRV